jgi:uncharacterized repeat protein (TIGR03803 family)
MMINKQRIRRLISETLRQKAGWVLLFAVLPILPLVAPCFAWGQTYSVLHNFTGGYDGATPEGSLILDDEGNLYGTTYQGGAFYYGTVIRLNPKGKVTTLHSFDGVDGMWPSSSLVRDAAGNLYGTTQDGGTPEGGSCRHGCGTVFKVDAAGKETVLYAFTGKADGSVPYAGLVRDSDGNLYGTTQWGGDVSACRSSGCGTVFKVDPTGKETVLYAFTGAADGASPQGSLVRDAAGNLYGAAQSGGDLSGCGGGGCGAIFELDQTGKERVLYAFIGGADGAGPNGVIRDSAGNFFGTTSEGGLASSGTVFKLSTTGKETILYSFTGGADGGFPLAGVIRDPAGNLHGTTARGGDFSSSCTFGGCGVVFKIDKDGKETVLHAFTDGVTQLGLPQPGVVQDEFGNLYGTFPYNSDDRCQDECGLVFKITPSGSHLSFFERRMTDPRGRTFTFFVKTGTQAADVGVFIFALSH